MGKHEVFEFANSLGLVMHWNSVRNAKKMSVEMTYSFYHLSLVPGASYNSRRELIATLRLDDQMNIVDYNNALAICMNTLKQYQSWS